MREITDKYQIKNIYIHSLISIFILSAYTFKEKFKKSIINCP